MTHPTADHDLVARLRAVNPTRYIKTLVNEAADNIEALRRSVGNLLATVDAKQAKIDALMMEFCPGEMSKEQRAEWARNQRPVTAEEHDALVRALEASQVDVSPPQEAK